MSVTPGSRLFPIPRAASLYFCRVKWYTYLYPPKGGAPISQKPYWEGKKYAFYQHRECEFFPCHATADPDSFNCLFCYCPLYALGDKCGGGFTYTDSGCKDCSKCLLPHKPENYGYIMERFGDIMELAKKKD